MATKKAKKSTTKTNGKSKTQAVVALMRRPKGVTRQEALDLTQWPQRITPSCSQGCRRDIASR